MVVREMAATVGLTISEAADARSGLDQIGRGRFDLILMDLRMPEMSGLTAIRQLRADGRDHDQHIVVITADLTPGVRELCTSAGADAFLEKPVSLQKLMEVVGSAMIRQPTFEIG
jgi:CheY-like chemotaxis protein